MTAKLSMECSEQSNGAYFAICPEIKGCFTQGGTYEQAMANLKELVTITVKATQRYQVFESRSAASYAQQ